MYALVTSVLSPTVFICSGLAGQTSGQYIGYSAAVLYDGGGTGAAPQGEKQLITAFNGNTGQMSIAAGYTAAIAVGDVLLLLHPSVANGMNSSGQATVSGTLSANWQAAEQTLVTIGANGSSFKLHIALVSIANLIGNITIRAYHRINGVERRIYPIPAATTFTAAASAPGIPIWDTTGVITEALRVTVQSDNAGDNGAAVDYEYKLEAM
jgi:hypothetical protein